jgi:hypothetical protein
VVAGVPTVTSLKLRNRVDVLRLVVSVVAEPEKEMFPSMELGIANRLLVNPTSSKEAAVKVVIGFVFIGSVSGDVVCVVDALLLEPSQWLSSLALPTLGRNT